MSRFAHDDPQHREASAKLIAIFLAFQSGTPFIYQGQEIGMTNVPKDWTMEEYKDIDCLNHYKYSPPLPLRGPLFYPSLFLPWKPQEGPWKNLQTSKANNGTSVYTRVP